MDKNSTEAENARLGLSHRYRLSENSESPLVLLVHGRAGTQQVMWAFRRSIPETYALVAPQAPCPDPLGGFSWWMVQNGRAESREAIEQAAGTLSSFLDQFIQAHHLRPRLILAFGFSQGAGLLSFLMQEKPALFRGVALLAGFVIKNPAISPEKLPPVFIAHGSLDETVPLALSEEGAGYLRSRGSEVTFSVSEVGHKVGSASMRALKEWTAAF